MSGELEGRVALVTGGSRGLGRAIVEIFAEAGARGAAVDVVSPSPELPDGWIDVRGDVCSETDTAEAMAVTAREFGRLDAVVANAGLVPPWRDTESLDMEEWRRVFDVNVAGVAITLKHAVPWLKRQGGSVVVMGSLNSRRAHPRQCLYTATKHAVLGIVRATALDLGRYGIRVNAVGPGPVATEALVERVRQRAAQGEPALPDVLEAYAAQTPLGRMSTADDVARAVLFLAGPRSDGITGQLLPVDAGLT